MPAMLLANLRSRLHAVLQADVPAHWQGRLGTVPDLFVTANAWEVQDTKGNRKAGLRRRNTSPLCSKTPPPCVVMLYVWLFNTKVILHATVWTRDVAKINPGDHPFSVFGMPAARARLEVLKNAYFGARVARPWRKKATFPAIPGPGFWSQPTEEPSEWTDLGSKSVVSIRHGVYEAFALSSAGPGEPVMECRPPPLCGSISFCACCGPLVCAATARQMEQLCGNCARAASALPWSAPSWRILADFCVSLFCGPSTRILRLQLTAQKERICFGFKDL
eukprot:gene22331-biopygen10243